MKLQNTSTRYVATALAAAAVLVLAAEHHDCLAQTSGEPTQRATNFGAVTLNAGQTARINALNPVLVQPEDATRGEEPGPAAERAARTWTLAFDLYAAEPPTEDGGSRTATKYRFLRRVSKEVTLAPGEGASFEFTAAETTRVNPVVIGPPDARGDDGSNVQSPNLLTTIEVREGGNTSFVHPGAARGMIICGARIGRP